MSDTFETSKDVEKLKRLYFSDQKKRLLIKKGETLLTEDNFNDRLFLVLNGGLTGYLKDENNEQSEVFQSSSNMFVGVYSFFSEEHKTYLTLVADEPTTVAYIDQDTRAANELQFANDFLPVIVHELYLRQMVAQRLTLQREAAIKKLYEKEKMATLGQLAAGLAHELNNAIGVLDKNTSWLKHALLDFLKNKKLRNLFLNTAETGQSLNTATLREKRKKLEKRFGISAALAKQLAKTSLTEDQIHDLLKENQKELDAINIITEAGIALHDMEVAATHATHVVQSVRILGMNNEEKSSQTSILETINRALALTKTLWQDLSLSVSKDTEGFIVANPGDLVQIWVNLIKNACESMSLAGTSEPALKIDIRDETSMYTVIVSDNGPGIKEDIIKKIFQPNFTTRVSGLSFGLGLGLSIVKKITNQHKGTVAVESKPGETNFIVKLPKS